MSKEFDLISKTPKIVEFMEREFGAEDGINKIAMLKLVANYYEHLVASESMRAIIIKTMGKI